MASAVPPHVPRRQTRSRRRARLRFRLGRALFVLPNLFTSASIFCGFYAILLASAPSTPAALYRASIAICFAIFFDMADGRVARLTRTQSEFGVQLDSLADIVSFGVAPAVLTYRWSLSRLGLLGVVVGFLYIAAGAARLARFNVLAARPARPSNAPPPPADSSRQRALPLRGVGGVAGPSYFLGLPIPLAAGVLAAAVMCAQRSAASTGVHRAAAAALILGLSALMVSNVRYRTFKEVRPTASSVSAAVALLGVFFVVSRLSTPALGGLVFFSAYVLLGLGEALLRAVLR